MEIPLEQQQVLTLTQTMHTNVFPTLSIVQDHMIDVCVCLTTVPVLPRPALSRVLTLLNFAQAAGPLSSLPARNHLTAVFKSHCQETSVCVCVRAIECVYLCEHDPGLRHVKRSGNKCRYGTYERHVQTFSKHKRASLCSQKSLYILK